VAFLLVLRLLTTPFPRAALLALFLTGCSAAPPLIPPQTFRSPLPGPQDLGLGPVRTIVLDAGHGGHDPGTSHFGLREKHLTLDVARRLRAQLEAAGFRVVMTRDADRFIPLSQRAAVANRLGADLFVSVHANANRSRSVSGAEVYYPRDTVVGPSAAWPPWVAPSEIGVPSQSIRHILWDLVLSRNRARARQLSAQVCQAMRQELDVPCKRRQARFVVLREARMPAVLVEVGYVSNPTENERLRNSEYRQAAARSIARGIVAYAR
jgi:N-acetylmuramoyl-L-alanine amidase